MNLILQSPALIGLLALAALPLLVHLLARAKPPSYHFSNLEFLRKVLRLTSRFRKPKDWLLLALRTLAILALAAAFLGPLLLSESSPLPGENRSIICLIDRSASMAAKEGAASRFEGSAAAATRLLNSTNPETANIIWIDSAPDSVFPEPGPNRDFLTDELARATARPEPNAIDAAFALAVRQLANAPGRRELHVFSDFQASAWQNAAPNLPADIDLHLIAAAKQSPTNLSVSSLVPMPASPVAGRDLLIQCQVTNHSNEPRRTTLVLDAGGSRQSRDLNLPANGLTEALFTVRVPSAGLLPVSAEIDADAFPSDNQRHAVVRVRESLRMAIAQPTNSPATTTLARLANALPWLDAIPDANPNDPPPAEILILPAWNGQNPENLLALAQSGTAVIARPTTLETHQLATLLGSSPPAASAPISREHDDSGWAVTPTAEHPAFALFADGSFGNPLGGSFQERLRLPNVGTTLARFNDGQPALLSHPSLPLLISNLPFDPATTTWPDRSAFVPAMAELILYLCPSPTSESFVANPGEQPSWIDPLGDTTNAPALIGPDGETIPVTSTHTDAGLTWSATKPCGPGLHRWTVSDQPVHFTAVNFPTSESALAPLEEPPAIRPGTITRHGLDDASAIDRGLALWPWLIAAALAFLLLEALITARVPKPAANPS